MNGGNEAQEGSRYRLYIDESGDHTFQLTGDPNHRYLGLVGIWFNLGNPYRAFCSELEALKQEIFARHPDEEPVCLHRKDVIERRGVFGRLRDQELNRQFESGLLRVVGAAECQIACVVLNKASHHTKTYRELFHPYHYCIAVLLERYVRWLSSVGAQGDVMAESRGRVEDQELTQAFEATLERGTRFIPAARFREVLTSGKIKLKKKSHVIAGLGLADLLAYPLRREMVAERDNGIPPRDFSAQLLDAARPKLHCDRMSRRVTRYGKIWLD